jgi:hypothetical protein
MTYDTQDEEEARVAEQYRQAALTALQEREDLRAVLGSIQGRSFLWTLLAGIYSNSHRGENTHESAFEEGRRKAALDLFARIFDADPNAYTLMRGEAVTRIPRITKAGDQES